MNNIAFQNLEQQNFIAATEEDVVRLMLKDKEFMTSYSEHISPQLFHDYLRPIVESSKKYWQQYSQLVPKHVLAQDLTNSIGVGCTPEKVDALKSHLETVYQEPKAPEYTTNMISTFIRLQRIENALVSGVRLFKEAYTKHEYGLIDKIPQMINDSIQPLTFNQPELFLAGLDSRTELRSQIIQGLHTRVGISTGILGLDKTLPYKGPEVGQLCMVMAPTGRGKSIALMYFAYAAALQGLNVVYFSLELPKDMMMDRIDSMVSKVPIHELLDQRDKVRKEIDIVTKELPLPNGFGEIAFYEIPCGSSVLTIKNELANFERRYHIKPDVVVVDYMDLMGATRHFKEGAWREQQEVARELRSFAVEYKALLWTASQTNRSAINKVEDGKMISDAEAAESYSKQSVADLIISLNQTAEERASKEQLKKLTLFVVKNRTGRGGCEISILTDFSKMCFFAGTPLSAEEAALQSGAFSEGA